MKKITKIELSYVRDYDGSYWLALTSGKPLHKDMNQWCGDDEICWVRVDSETKEPDEDIFIAKFIDLHDVPEPSWEDEEPISVFITISTTGYCINETE